MTTSVKMNVVSPIVEADILRRASRFIFGFLLVLFPGCLFFTTPALAGGEIAAWSLRSPSPAPVRADRAPPAAPTAVPEGTARAAPPAAGVPNAGGALGGGLRPALAAGVFLVASRHLNDPNFAHSVVLLLAHDDNGAMGVVINRPSGIALAEVLPQVQRLKKRTDQVYIGGPVARTSMLLLIRARHQPQGTERVLDGIYASGSLTVLRHLLGQHGSGEGFRAYAGYAGWAPGQLESEIARGDWYLWRASAEAVFAAHPAQVWDELIRQASGRWVRLQDGLEVADGLPLGLAPEPAPELASWMPQGAGEATPGGSEVETARVPRVQPPAHTGRIERSVPENLHPVAIQFVYGS